jgi:NADPH-dependent glutamate synthase beta subunit-like oxidoreductase
MVSTVKVANGQAVAASAAVALSKEVIKTMFFEKLKLAVGAVMVVAALGAGGVAYQVSGPRAAQAAPEGKPVSELEALRRENELLKLNLQVVLEKVRAQEAELRAVKGRVEALGKERVVETRTAAVADREVLSRWAVRTVVNLPASEVPDPAQQVEAALKAFREAKDPEAKRHAAAALEAAAKRLREQPQKPEKPSKQGGER